MATFTLTIEDAALERLVKTAKRTIVGDEDDFNAYDYCGGNYDDAYERGWDDGCINGAQELLDLIGVNYE